MKTKFLKLSCLALMLFTLFGCCEECNDSLKEANTKIEMYEKQELANNEIRACEDDQATTSRKPVDLSLKFNCGDTKHFQHLHIDLVNRFSLLGKVIMNSNEMLSLEVMKKEIGTCNYLKLVSFKYTHSEPGTNAEGKIIKIHHFDLSIKDNDDGTNASTTKTALVKTIVNIDDLIDIHINPKAQKDMPETYANEYFQQPWTNYGQQFCKSTITLNP